ncbi:MAG: DNA polymerase III subunit delta' [Pseudomonadota bacterium]
MTDWPNHSAAWREWRQAMSGARMHHGWIFAGKSGLGKFDFARKAARELVAQVGIPQPDGDHPDIVELTYGAKNDKEARAQADGKPFERARSIRVDQIRQMQRRLTTRPTLGDRRIIIIHPADDMERNAANALLKSLEEPPQGTFFILVTHRPSRLLPTIRSRCRMVRFPIISSSNMRAMLEIQGTADPASIDAAIAAAEGSYGAALRFVKQDLGKLGTVIEALITKGDQTLSLRAELSRSIGPRADRDRISATLELAQAITAAHARKTSSSQHRAKLIDAHGALVKLAAEAPSYNYDAGLLTLEIGTLLSAAAPASEHAHG